MELSVNLLLIGIWWGIAEHAKNWLSSEALGTSRQEASVVHGVVFHCERRLIAQVKPCM